MTQISLRFVIPTVLAIVLGIVLAFCSVYLGHYFGPVDQAEANQCRRPRNCRVAKS